MLLLARSIRRFILEFSKIYPIKLHLLLQSRFRVPLLLAAISATVYLSILPAHILGGDNAEFAALSRYAGVGHPPGYPLYHLYLRATAWLPGTPAYASALATSILAILQIFVLALACQRWNLSNVGTVMSVGVFALSSLALVHYTQAEVFALNGLLVSCFLCLVAPVPVCTSLVQIIFLGLLTGLALSHHHTAVLLLPLLLLGIFLNIKSKPRDSTAAIPLLVFIAAIVAGLLPYSYYLFQSHEPTSSQLVWTNINSLSALLRHFFRQEYGTFDLSAHSPNVNHFEQLSLLLDSIVSTWRLLSPFAVLGFAAAFISRQNTKSTKLLWLALFLSFLLSGPILVLRFNLEVNFLLAVVIERFHILPNQLLVIPVAKGIDAALITLRTFLAKNYLENDWFDPQRSILFAIPVATVLYCFVLSLPRLESRNSPVIENLLRNTLLNMPHGSLLIGTGDHQRFGYPYLQEIQGVRKDVIFTTIGSISSESYCRGVQYKMRGIRSSVIRANCNLLDFIELAHQQKRRVFLHLPLGPASEWNEILNRYPSQIYGTALEILPMGKQPMDLERQYVRNEQLFNRYKFGYNKPWSGHDWSTLSQQAYSSSWLILSQRLGFAGLRRLAERSLEQANKYMPYY